MYDFNRQWLVNRFSEIEKRILKALDQLDDEQLNSSIDDYSNNIPTLLRHIEGNIKERILNGINQQETTRDRATEFNRTYMTKSEAALLVQSNFDRIIDLVKHISDETLERTQAVRGKERTNMDILHQCATHYSEHMGQILYITKHIMNDQYITTSI